MYVARTASVQEQDETMVSGDIRALGEMTNLRQLWLAGTNVSGDLGELVKLEKLLWTKPAFTAFGMYTVA